MKRLLYLILPAIILASCGGSKTGNSAEEITKLKKQRADIDQKLLKLEGATKDTSKKATPVFVKEVQPGDFIGFVQVQSQITGDQNVYASPQTPGIVKDIFVKVGQHVNKGQVLAQLDNASVQQQLGGLEAQLSLMQTLYEKQQKLWAQGIGTEVQLLSAKANYISALKNKEALVATKNTFNIIAPISGIVDYMSLKIGDASAPGSQAIRIVSQSQLKAEANLGENYLGDVRTGNQVTILFPNMKDSIKTRLTYVSEAVDPISRAFLVQVMLSPGGNLHPNMSCTMKITNYENKNALVVPVSTIQNTSKGELLYIAEGGVAKAVQVKTGHNSNGQVEIVSGLKPGDKVITAGFEDLDNGDPITTQQ